MRASLVGGFAAAAALANCLSQCSAETTKIVDSTGALSRSSLSSGAISRGVVAVVNPSSYFKDVLEGVNGNDLSELTSQTKDECTVLLTPGANVVPSTRISGPGISSTLKSGFGCAAASVGAGVVIVDGFELSDLICDDADSVVERWRDSRHGRSLAAIFAAHAEGDLTKRRKKVALVLGVNGDVKDLKKQQEIMMQVGDLHREVMETKRLLAKGEGEGSEDVDDSVFGLTDVYDVMLVELRSESDAKKAWNLASQTAPERTPENKPLASNLFDTFSLNWKPSSLLYNVLTSPRSVAADMMVCTNAYLQNARAIRARTSSWKQRVIRNITIDRFGSQATALHRSVLQNFDYETCSLAGGAAGNYRLAQRAKLEECLSRTIGDLFQKQISILEQNSIKQLEKSLLQLRKSDSLAKLSSKGDAEAAKERLARQYDDKAAAVRAAAFAFDTKSADLEVPSLSLYKASASRELSSKLDMTLNKIDSNPLAQIQDMKMIKKSSERKAPIKKKRKSELSVDVGLSLVAMFRPDGYGNLQGYTGYNLGPHSITVGIQNDADTPEVMNQFGGVRPPFLRVQPKLNFDVEV